MGMRNIISGMLCCLIIIILGYAKALPARSVGSQKSFNRVVEKHPFAIVMLYLAEKKLKKNDKELYNRIKSARNEFKQTSKMQQYKAANMAFIQANVAEKKLEYLPDNFNISVRKEPVYILFSNGLPVTSKGDIVVTTQGFLDAPSLKSFIDTHLYDAIEDYVDDKRERRAQERELARTAVYFGGGYPWYGYYPYYGGWGYPGYGYGPRFSFGVGF